MWKIDDTIDRFTQQRDIIIDSDQKFMMNELYPWNISYGLDSYTLRSYIGDIITTTQYIANDYVYGIHIWIMDIYFLRRFLDKDYITNAITYAGKAHSISYLYILVKYFDFQITHISHSAVANVKKLTKKIKKITLDDVPKISQLITDQEIQCSDMTDFPVDFT
jgi:hypothetical protein